MRRPVTVRLSFYLHKVNASLVAIENALYDNVDRHDFLHGRTFETLCEQYLRSRAGRRWQLILTGDEHSLADEETMTVRLGAGWRFEQALDDGLDAAVDAVCYTLAHEAAHARHSRLASTRSLNRELAQIGRHDRHRETTLTWLWNTVEDGRVEQQEGRENHEAARLFGLVKEQLHRQATCARTEDEALRCAVAYRARGGLKPFRLSWPVEVCLVECDRPLGEALEQGNRSLKPLERIADAIAGRCLTPELGYYARAAVR